MDRVSRAKAARLLNIDRSTLTRWIQKHPALLDDAGLVDPDQLREHRDAVANPKLQTRGRKVSSDAAAPAAADGGSAASVLNDHRARGEAAKSIIAELDLADRLKLTLVREDVEAQIGQAGELLKREALEMAKDLAEPLARIDDPRIMEQTLSRELRKLLDKSASALILAMGQPDSESDAA